jgi:polysaccharide export outer membrane protein
MKNNYFNLIFLVFFLMCGCKTMQAAKNPSAENDSAVQLSVQEQQIAGSIDYKKQYKINPTELLQITVYQEPDLERTVRVTNDGCISYPLIGKVQVSGLTVIEAEEKIAALLGKDYYVNPQVSIFIKEFQAEKVVIIGEVKNPGAYDLPQGREITLLEAVALAGGFTKVASADSIRIIRVENGKQKYIPVRVSDITKGGDKSKDIILKPGDIIYIPERIF